MALFTVVVSFLDRTNGIEQYESRTPHDALVRFLSEAESLADYPKEQLLRLVGGGSSVELVHVTNGLRGFWIWVPVFGSDPHTDAILSGYIIQTDANGPIRGK